MFDIKKGFSVLGPFRARAASEVQGNGNDRQSVVEPQDGIIVEHAPRKIGLRLELNLHVHQDELVPSLSGPESCHDVGLPHRSIGNVREDLLVQEAKGFEIELTRYIRKEKLQEFLELMLENGFE
jgi:hypothetical protein